ncbi:MAG: MAPEG family protein [Nannocystis sp.]|nr:MAPEG family protein [Nannocystis sp.]MBA3548292.1 MAPEG family protein [Nannocystis sp.]
MSIDLWMLFGAVILGLVHVGAASMSFKAQVGNRYTVGARDENLQPTHLAGRLERAQRNFGETFPLFAAVVLALQVTGKADTWTALGAELYLGGRIAYLPAYASGLPWIRTICWQVATIGLVIATVQLAR